MQFPGVVKDMWKFLEPIKKEVDFQGELMWNRILVFDLGISLGFPRGTTHFCRISWGESLFSPEKGDFQKSTAYVQPHVWILSGIAQ